MTDDLLRVEVGDLVHLLDRIYINGSPPLGIVIKDKGMRKGDASAPSRYVRVWWFEKGLHTTCRESWVKVVKDNS
tara:strand:+ start:183 stop:407 length:225 start_codon:yes stop_codon:yes gene_type:complete